jgi:hypothetical protein
MIFKFIFHHRVDVSIAAFLDTEKDSASLDPHVNRTGETNIHKHKPSAHQTSELKGTFENMWPNFFFS